MTVADMTERMSATEFVHWQCFYDWESKELEKRERERKAEDSAMSRVRRPRRR
jgi:hypothetical protein